MATDLYRAGGVGLLARRLLDAGILQSNSITVSGRTIGEEAREASETPDQEVVRTLDKMGERIYGCTDPTGYYDVAESWMDSGVLTSRWDFCYRHIHGKVKGDPYAKVEANQ